MEALREAVAEKFTAMKNKAQDFVDAVQAIPGKLEHLASKFKTAGKALLTGFLGGLSSATDFVTSLVGNVWDAISGFLNEKVLGPLDSVISFKVDWPGPGSFSFNPDIPRLARGGLVKARHGGTLALLGEGGYDEMVIPMDGRYAPKGARVEAGVNYTGRGETHLHFYGDLEFPNIETADDAEAFIKQLEILAEA
jgi:phage-related protein